MFIRHRHWNREINILERNYFVGLAHTPPLLLLRCFRHLCYFVNDARTIYVIDRGRMTHVTPLQMDMFMTKEK